MTETKQDTACSKCGARMPQFTPVKNASPINMMKMTITAYRCDTCGHWNNLKRRKKKGQP